MKRRRLVILIASAALAIGVIYYIWNRRSSTYRLDQLHGDGKIVYHEGYWPYPDWYEVHFQEIPFDQPGTYHFRCGGLPPLPLTFYLGVPCPPEKRAIAAQFEQLLPTLTTYVSITIVDGDGKALGSGSGKLSDHGKSASWNLSGMGVDVFSHAGARRLTVRPDGTYQIDLVIQDIDPKALHLKATPMLVCRP